MLIRPWVRLVLATTLDGRITKPSGGPVHFGGDGDRKILEESLAWADGALIGGGTLRAHKSTCLIRSSSLISKRISDGRSEQPISLVVSNRRDYPNDWLFFKQPITRWILRREPKEFSESTLPFGYQRQIFLKDQWTATLGQLQKVGLSKLVLLGGGKLIASMLETDTIDELQLTLTPRIVGGSHTWVPINTNHFIPNLLSRSDAWILKKSEILEGNELLLRLLRNR